MQQTLVPNATKHTDHLSSPASAATMKANRKLARQKIAAVIRARGTAPLHRSIKQQGNFKMSKITPNNKENDKQLGAPTMEQQSNPGQPVESVANQSQDPFDLSKIAVTGVTAEDLGVEKPILAIPVDKPGRQDFFRTHPDPTFRIEARILKLEAERETYLVTTEVWTAIPGETKLVRLVPYLTRSGSLGLWPVALPDDLLGKRDTRWGITARAAAEFAEKKWVRMQANMALGSYDVVTTVKIPDPVWPDITFQKILEIAFGNERLITTLDHPVIRQLQGE